MLTATEMQMMIGSAANAYVYGASNPAPAGTTFVQGLDDPNTGAHAQIYQVNGTSEYIVAFTGTEPGIGGQDLYSDFGHYGMNQWDALKPQLDTFLVSRSISTIDFTGESLGGALGIIGDRPRLFANMPVL